MYQDKLKFLRERKNLTITDIATILNIDRSQYGHYENNHITIPLKHIINLSNFYNVSLDYILNMGDTPNYPNIKTELNIEIIGQRLKDLRKEKNLTQEKLANILNTNKSVISRYEKGTNLINFSFLYEICKKYSISADYLLGRIDSPKYLK